MKRKWAKRPGVRAHHSPWSAASSSRCPCHQGSLGLWIWSGKGPGREHRGSALYCTPKLSVLDLPAPFRFLTVPGRVSVVALARALALSPGSRQRRLAGVHALTPTPRLHFLPPGRLDGGTSCVVAQGSSKQGPEGGQGSGPGEEVDRGPLDERGAANRGAHLKATTASLWPAQVCWPAQREGGQHATGRFRVPLPRASLPIRVCPHGERGLPQPDLSQPRSPSPQAKHLPAAGCNLCAGRSGGRGHGALLCQEPVQLGFPGTAGNWSIINLWPKLQL